MTDIELVIKIPKEIYESNKRECEENDALIIDTFTLAIGNGTPLPKGHGRLIDADEVIKIANKTKDLHGAIWNAQTIIEADTESEEV